MLLAKLFSLEKQSHTMRYHQEIIIDIPFDTMIELFENPDNLQKWQPDVKKFERVSGEIGQPGAVSRMTVNMVVKDLVLTETIMKRNLPQEFVIKYETDGATNIVTNNFKEIDGKKTRWIMNNDYTFSGFAKYAVIPLKGIFKKQTQVTMERFKKFAENLPVS